MCKPPTSLPQSPITIIPYRISAEIYIHCEEKGLLEKDHRHVPPDAIPAVSLKIRGKLLVYI